jgi:1,2-diacylglycerol 3-alpha-glucosyltransferase
VISQVSGSETVMPFSRLNRLCLQWPRFGPYYLARLRATHAMLDAQGVELVGLETASEDALYGWRVEQGEEPFRREQALPGRVFEHVPPAEMRAATIEALDRIDPDAVGIMSYGYPDGRAALEWCRRRRRVAVLMTDSKADDAVRIGWRERIKSIIVSQYDAALVAGRPQRAYLEQLGFPSELIFTGYAAVDNNFFRRGAEAARRHPEAVRHLPGLADASPFFLASNRFLPIKNLSRLLEAYAAYRARAREPWRLLLLGDGPERPELEAQIAKDRIEGVVLCGFRQIDELPAYYGRAGAFVHPTLKDTWGLVVNEAMAAGLPVLVSTRAGCAQDLVLDNHTGYTFDPLDVPIQSTLLERVAGRDVDLVAMGRRAQSFIEDFSCEAFARGFWDAAQAGRVRSVRGFGVTPRTVFRAMRVAARDVRTFHSTQV